MVVVAGPPGAGKSIAFPVAAIAARHRMTSFNIDDRCAERNGSYRNIPPELRREVQLECERFIVERIQRREGFAVETTLRTTVGLMKHEPDAQDIASSVVRNTDPNGQLRWATGR